MKNIFTSVFLVLVFSVAASAYNTKVYTKQGGAEMVVASGGTLTLEAGSTLAVDQASVLSISTTPTFDAITVTGNVGAATLSASGASTLLGAVYAGADGTKSTMATNGVITSGAGIVATTSMSAGTSIAAGTTVTGGTGLISTAGPIRSYSRSKAQILALPTPAVGDEYYCSDCTAVTKCVSTGTVVGSFVKISDKSAPCD